MDGMALLIQVGASLWLTILVAGAGPAGSRLASFLAKKGVKVILVERLKSSDKNAFSSAVLPINALEQYSIPQESISRYWNTWKLIGPEGACSKWQSNNSLYVIC